MNTKVNEISGNLMGKGLKIGMAVSRFNDFFTKELVGGAVDCLVRHGVADKDVTVVWVPGANELPFAVRKMILKGGYDAVIALGVVIQGATPHADLINSQVARSLSAIALETQVPVINAVVCADNLDQAIERCGTKAGNKGWNGAQAAIEMANLCRQMGA
ncbi:MAG: 6,7-dimethyl-8-ribityllumazine synthase [bacterium]